MSPMMTSSSPQMLAPSTSRAALRLTESRTASSSTSSFQIHPPGIAGITPSWSRRCLSDRLQLININICKSTPPARLLRYTPGIAVGLAPGPFSHIVAIDSTDLLFLSADNTSALQHTTTEIASGMNTLIKCSQQKPTNPHTKT